MELQRNTERLPISQVNMSTRYWTTLVQVLEKHHPQMTAGQKSPPKRYQRYVLIDDHATKVTAVVYENDIPFYTRVLIPFRRYCVSNAPLLKATYFFKVGQYEYTWVLDRHVFLQPFEEPAPPLLPCGFHFTPFADLFKYADSDTLIDVQGIVIHAFPLKQLTEIKTAREFIIINEEKIPMSVTLWDAFAEQDGASIAAEAGTIPIIIGTKLKVTTSNGLSLSSHTNSYFMLNPPVRQIRQLTEWFIKNREDVNELLEDEAHRDLNRLLPPPDPQHVLTLDRYMTMKGAAWVKGYTQFIQDRKQYYYTACENCNKSLHAEPDWILRCPSCREDVGIIIRSRVGVFLSDENTSIAMTMYSPDIDALTGITPAKLRDAEEFGFPVMDDLIERFYDKKIVCFLKKSRRPHRTGTSTCFTVMKAYPYPTVSHCEPTLTPTLPFPKPPATSPILTTPPLFLYPAPLENPHTCPDSNIKQAHEDTAESSTPNPSQTIHAKRNLHLAQETFYGTPPNNSPRKKAKGLNLNLTLM